MPSLTLPAASDLPYFLPADSEGQLRELAKILDISFSLAKSGGTHAVDA